MVKHKSVNRKKDLLALLAGVLIVILINYITSFVFFRLDLTSEHRYTLSKTSKNLAKNLKDVVYVKVYLEGNFPADYKRLRDETKEMLDEFRAYADDNLEYEFINPATSGDDKITKEIYKQLYKKGLRPTDLPEKTSDGFSNKVIWPGAIFSYRGKEIPVQLLKDQVGSNLPTMLNNSIEGLEYNIANAINSLVKPQKQKIAFIDGHGELTKYEVASISDQLKEFYDIDRLEIDGNLSSLTERFMPDSSKKFIVQIKYNAIVIAKPTENFSEKDKFIIDQYIMYGGKVVWLIDPVFATMDSLKEASTTMAIPQDLNLNDQLFTYGVRLNTNLIQDIQSVPIPLVTGTVGNQPKTQMFPWYYFPLLSAANNHPIVKNLNPVKGEFVSTIDTISRPGIKKTPLLVSSQYTKISSTPSRVSLSILRFDPDQAQFNKGPQLAAVLLEGKFESDFKNRITPQIRNANAIAFKDESKTTAMVVVSDGDITKNVVNPKTEEYLPLGVDKYTKQEYGNADFMLNVVNYLCDDSGLMSIRNKNLKIRLLDETLIKEDRLKWELINTLIPIIFIALFGFIFFIIRKRKYTH